MILSPYVYRYVSGYEVIADDERIQQVVYRDSSGHTHMKVSPTIAHTDKYQYDADYHTTEQ